MKVIQIACANTDGEVYGLGDDGLVYIWRVVPVGKWEFFGNASP